MPNSDDYSRHSCKCSQIKTRADRNKNVLCGGSFGRRITPTSDYHVDAALAFDLLGRETPVKLVFTREDDIKGGWYRPMHIQRAKIGLGKTGNIVAWDHRSSCKSIAKGTFREHAR